MIKKHTLRFRAVNKDIFEAIRAGRKTVETRAATIKYRNIQAGDKLARTTNKILLQLPGLSRKNPKVRHYRP